MTNTNSLLHVVGADGGDGGLAVHDVEWKLEDWECRSGATKEYQSMSRKQTTEHVQGMLDEVGNALKTGDIATARKLLILAREMIEHLELTA